MARRSLGITYGQYIHWRTWMMLLGSTALGGGGNSHISVHRCITTKCCQCRSRPGICRRISSARYASTAEKHWHHYQTASWSRRIVIYIMLHSASSPKPLMQAYINKPIRKSRKQAQLIVSHAAAEPIWQSNSTTPQSADFKFNSYKTWQCLQTFTVLLYYSRNYDIIATYLCHQRMCDPSGCSLGVDHETAFLQHKKFRYKTKSDSWVNQIISQSVLHLWLITVMDAQFETHRPCSCNITYTARSLALLRFRTEHCHYTEQRAVSLLLYHTTV